MDKVAVVLLILYLVIFLLLSLQLSKIFLSNDQVITIRNSILTILTCSCFLRCLLWLKLSIIVSVPTYIMLILFFVPIWLNFFGFSLLNVFYWETWIQATKTKQNKSMTLCMKPLTVCLHLNFIFFIFIVVIIAVISQNSDHSTIITSIYEGYMASLDFILSSALMILGYKFYNSYGKKATKLLPRSLLTFYVINCLLSLVYGIKGILSVLIALQIKLPFNVSVDFSENHRETLSVLFFFFFLEWIPICNISFLLWRRLKSSSNENMEKLLTPISTSVDEESHIHINYSDINKISDAEAISAIVNENSIYSSTYLVNENEVIENVEEESVFYSNYENVEDSFDTIEASSLIKSPQNKPQNNSRTMHVGFTPPPLPKATNNKHGAIDFFINPSLFTRTSPFAIINSSRESSPSIQQASPASNSYEYILLSKYTPPRLGDSIKSHLHTGNPIISDRDITKLYNQESLDTRDSIGSESEKNN